jgi:hypothetical protein
VTAAEPFRVVPRGGTRFVIHDGVGATRKGAGGAVRMVVRVGVVVGAPSAVGGGGCRQIAVAARIAVEAAIVRGALRDARSAAEVCV